MNQYIHQSLSLINKFVLTLRSQHGGFDRGQNLQLGGDGRNALAHLEKALEK